MEFLNFFCILFLFKCIACATPVEHEDVSPLLVANNSASTQSFAVSAPSSLRICFTFEFKPCVFIMAQLDAAPMLLASLQITQHIKGLEISFPYKKATILSLKIISFMFLLKLTNLTIEKTATGIVIKPAYIPRNLRVIQPDLSSNTTISLFFLGLMLFIYETITKSNEHFSRFITLAFFIVSTLRKL